MTSGTDHFERGTGRAAAMTAAGDRTRRTAGGDFAKLSEGVTFFMREGPADGVPVVLLHGATVPCWEFDVLVPHLLAAGRHVLRFDLFGHGHSERPPGDYSLARFVRQTVELVETTRFPRPALVLGHSLGAAIASAVAVERPDWVSRLVLVAPMVDFNATSRWAAVLKFPGVGELLMRYVALPGLVRRRRERYTRIGQPQLIERFIEHASIDGFGRALLSMIRTATLGDQTARYAALRGLERDLLVIAGSNDAVIPAADIARVRTLLPPHAYHEIAGAEHNLLLTHADIVAAVLAGKAESDGRGRVQSGRALDTIAPLPPTEVAG